METSLLLSFLGASVLLSFMPGPDNIFVLSESLSRGPKTGITISIGLVSGVLIHTLLAATGISLLISKSQLAFDIIKYVGATYLFYLAYQATKEKPIAISYKSQTSQSETKSFKLFSKGFLMNVTNPKVSLFFIAFLPQFITKDEMNYTLQMIILGIIFIIQALIIFSGIALLAGQFSKQLNKASFWTYTKWTKVIILSVLGISLLI